MDERMTSEDSLQTVARIRLAVLPSTDEVLRNLGTFAFVASQLFPGGGLHELAVGDILHLIEILEDIHTEVKGMIPPPYLAMPLLYDVSRSWSLYLNR